MIQSKPFPKEFRVVGQICREGMNESGILLKARYAMTIGHCLEQQGSGGAVSPPAAPGQNPGVGPKGRSPRKLQRSYSTQYQKNAPKNYFLGIFLSLCCIQIEWKNSFKLKKIMCKANISTSCSVNISKCISW